LFKSPIGPLAPGDSPGVKVCYQSMIPLTSDIAAKRDCLLELLRSYGSCLAAFSGGLDSSVLAKAACLALGDRAVAATGVSASLAAGELEACVALARSIGIRHEILPVDELSLPAYRANRADRCYHCKNALFERMETLAKQQGLAVIADGSNADDYDDHRPGMRAARDRRVKSPLAECGLTKAELRALAAHWELPTADKPAMPCLSSRIAYGEEITPERLAMIDRAERFLRERGFRPLRVRYHRGEMARIEVAPEALPRLLEPEFRAELVRFFQSLGFKYISLDLEGFRSGSLNAVLLGESLPVS
jgi:pyridinium-3,5-biscarboxylic acid mononucleotide sulfurtransferase